MIARAHAARRVLHLLGTADAAGAGIARIVRSLALGLDPEAYVAEAAFPEPGPWRDALGQAGIATWVTGWRRGSRDPLGALRFAALVRRRKVDILHLHAGGLSPLLAGRAAGARTVLHLWSHIDESRGLEPLTVDGRAADAVVATSRYVAGHVRAARVRVIHPGIPVPLQPPDPAPAAAPLVIGSAGRLVPMKGYGYLIEALASLQHEFPDLRLEIAGAGPEAASLQKLALDLRVSGRLSLLGWQPELGQHLARWHLYVQPSLCEPFGIAAVEAMAAGLPVVATSGAGLAEVVEDGRTGLLAPPGEVGPLAEAIAAVLRDESLRRTMGRQGHARALRCFSVRRMVDQFAALYDDV